MGEKRLRWLGQVLSWERKKGEEDSITKRIKLHLLKKKIHKTKI